MVFQIHQPLLALLLAKLISFKCFFFFPNGVQAPEWLVSCQTARITSGAEKPTRCNQTEPVWLVGTSLPAQRKSLICIETQITEYTFG